MPYAPGIQDISGQLLAQGMQQRAQGFAQGFTQFIGGIEQNKRMTNDALAKFQGAVAANPNLLPFLESANNEEDPNAPRINPEIVKAFSEVKQGKTDVWNTALLANFVETYNKSAAEAQMMAYRQAETARLKAATGMETLKTQQLKAEMDADAAWNNRQPQPQAVRQQAAPPPQMATPATFEEALSQQIPSYGGSIPQNTGGVPASLAKFAGPSAGAQMAQAASAADIGEIPPVPEPGSMQEMQDPYILKAAQQLRRSPNNRSAMPQIRQLAQNYRQEAEKQAALRRRQSVIYNQAQGLQKVRELNTDPNRDPSVINVLEPSETGGGYVIKQMQKGGPTPQEKQAEKEFDVQMDVSKSLLQDDRVAIQSMQAIAPQVNRLRQMLSSKELDTGQLANAKNAVRSWAKGLGMTLTPEDERQLQSAQTAQALMGTLIIPLWQQSKGNTTNREQEMFQSWNPNMKNVEGANKELLDMMDKKIKLNLQLGELHSQALSGDIKIQDYIRRRQKMMSDFDKSLPDAEEFQAKYGGNELASAGAGTTGGAAGPVTVTSQAQYDALPKGTLYRDSQGTVTTKK